MREGAHGRDARHADPADQTAPHAAIDGEPPAGVDIGVAIGVPEPYRTELQDARVRFGDPNAAFIVPHVTLLGPTTVAVGDLPAIEHHLAQIAEKGTSFVIRLRGSGTFRPMSPVVFVALAMGISWCEELADAVRSGPLERPLAFPYHPHVTVAHDIAEEGLDHAFDALADYQAQFEVHGFGLYERRLDRHWRQLRFFPFGHSTDSLGPGGGGDRRNCLNFER